MAKKRSQLSTAHHSSVQNWYSVPTMHVNLGTAHARRQRPRDFGLCRDSDSPERYSVSTAGMLLNKLCSHNRLMDIPLYDKVIFISIISPNAYTYDMI